jgi:hypothetical protein
MRHIEHDMVGYIRDPNIPRAMASKFCTGVLSIELATCHPSDTQTSGVSPRFLENLWIHVVYGVMSIEFTYYSVRRTAH